MDGALSSSSDAQAISELNIMGSWGCILLGTCLSAISWGVASMQMYVPVIRIFVGIASSWGLD